jgi:hypothetical protein
LFLKFQENAAVFRRVFPKSFWSRTAQRFLVSVRVFSVGIISTPPGVTSLMPPFAEESFDSVVLYFFATLQRLSPRVG